MSNLTHLSDPATGMSVTVSPEQNVMEIFAPGGHTAALMVTVAEAHEAIANLLAAGWVDSELWQRFEDEKDWGRWVRDIELGDGSTASEYVAPQHPKELAETMIWSVELAETLAHQRAVGAHGYEMVL